ncbi:hypothetical protein FACS189434_06460 [Bacteroidia bacterium]|nr:hypothetical protein FACS189434_06460 [Bacteroidia bacterium]
MQEIAVLKMESEVFPQREYAGVSEFVSKEDENENEYQDKDWFHRCWDIKASPPTPLHISTSLNERKRGECHTEVCLYFLFYY